MPGTATTVFEEGLAIPPIQLYHGGVRNEAVFTIIKRNTRVPEMLAADLDSEVQACAMGARRLEGLFTRFGRDTVETRGGRVVLEPVEQGYSTSDIIDRVRRADGGGHEAHKQR